MFFRKNEAISFTSPVSPLPQVGYGNIFSEGTKNYNYTDLSKKRRSSSVEENGQGKSFLKRNKGQKRTNRRFFLKDEQNSAQESEIKGIIAAIRSMNQYQVARVCQILNLEPQSHISLFQVLERSISNPKLLESLKSAINPLFSTKGLNGSSNNGTDTLCDCRYSICESNPFPLPDPIIVGRAPFETTYVCPPLSDDIHLIIQSFVISHVNNMIKWPHSMKIFVNDHLVKPIGSINSHLIDMSVISGSPSVHLTCASEHSTFNIVLKFAHYRSYTDIIRSIKQKSFNETIVIDKCGVLDPTTGSVLRYPGKGKQCSHGQCFNIKEYIRRANRSRSWVCPICRNPVFVDDLVFSHHLDRIIEEKFFKNTIIESPKPDEMEISIQLFDEHTDTNVPLEWNFA